MALTTLDSKKQLMLLPAFDVPYCSRMTHRIFCAKCSVCMSLFMHVCPYCLWSSNAFILCKYFSSSTSRHASAVISSQFAYNYSSGNIHGYKVLFCMTYTLMQFFCSLLKEPIYKYKTIENFLFQIQKFLNDFLNKLTMEKVSAMLVCSIFLKSVFCFNIGMMTGNVWS